jgi:hypothetical protein
MAFRPCFNFDEALGVYRSHIYTDTLRRKADKPGPVFYPYGAIKMRCGLDTLAGSDVERLLVYQLRGLRSAFPGVTPELRVSVAMDYGRMRVAAWYAPEFEGTLLAENTVTPWIDPEEVL